MNKRTLDAIAKLEELIEAVEQPGAEMTPYHWDWLLSTAAVLSEEAGRVNRRDASKPKRKVGGGTTSRKPANEPTEATKTAVADRSNGWCEIVHLDCTGRASEIHHRLTRSQGGGHELVNLLHLCAAGHRFVHAQPKLSYERGWLLHRGAL